MDNQRFFKERHIIAALVISIIGIVCMRVGGEVVKNIGSVLLVSGVYTVFDSMFLKQSLLDLIIQKVKLDKDIDSTGLVTIDATLTNIDYKSYIENIHKEMDIVHNYGRTWTTNNYDFIKDAVLNKECKIRVVLLNPASPFVKPLEAHYGYPEGRLVSLINESTEKWEALIEEINRKKEICKRRKHAQYKNKRCGEIELYFFNGQPANSIYRIDDTIIMVSVKNSSEKSVHLPYFIFKNNGDGGLYNNLYEEINNIINNSVKVERQTEEK